MCFSLFKMLLSGPAGCCYIIVAVDIPPCVNQFASEALRTALPRAAQTVKVNAVHAMMLCILGMLP